MIRTLIAVLNQSGDVVMSLKAMDLLRLRSAPSAARADAQREGGTVA